MLRRIGPGYLVLLLLAGVLLLALPAGAEDPQEANVKDTTAFDTPTPNGIPVEQEAQLRAFLAPRLDRSDEGLVMVVEPDGGITMDPQGRLQTVVLARFGEDGKLQVYSFDELESAMGFLTFEMPTPPPADGTTAAE